jgi:hypothetical protein
MNTLQDAGSSARTACNSAPSPASLIEAHYALACAHTEVHSVVYGGFARDIDIQRGIITPPPTTKRLPHHALETRLIALSNYLHHLFYRTKE